MNVQEKPVGRYGGEREGQLSNRCDRSDSGAKAKIVTEKGRQPRNEGHTGEQFQRRGICRQRFLRGCLKPEEQRQHRQRHDEAESGQSEYR